MGKRDKSRSAQRSESPAIDKSQNQRPESSGSDEIYEVECIVAHRIRNGKTEFKVRWFGWSEEYDEWCDPSRMDCPDAIKDYWDRVANRSGVKQQRMDITSSDSDTSPSKQHASSSSKSKRKSEMDTEQLHQISEDAVVDSPNMNENTSGATTYRTSDKNDILKKHTSKKKERRIERVDRSPLSEKSDVVPYVADTSNSATVSSIPVDDDMSGNRCSASVRSSEHQVTSAAITSSVNGHEKAEDVDVDVGASVSSTTCEAKKPESQKPFVRPHGFERGLTVERIHQFIRRGGLIFGIVEFKNCDVVEFLSTKIIQQYEPMALIRGLEEHHNRCRRDQRSCQQTAALQSINHNHS